MRSHSVLASIGCPSGAAPPSASRVPPAQLAPRPMPRSIGVTGRRPDGPRRSMNVSPAPIVTPISAAVSRSYSASCPSVGSRGADGHAGLLGAPARPIRGCCRRHRLPPESSISSAGSAASSSSDARSIPPRCRNACAPCWTPRTVDAVETNRCSASCCTTVSSALNSLSCCSVSAIACCTRSFASCSVALSLSTSLRIAVVM